MSYLQKLRKARTRKDVADLLGFRLSSISYVVHKLTDDEKYTTFELPKRDGTMRTIKAPIPSLRSAQRHLANVLYACRDEILATTGRTPLSHGFERGRSIITNASRHKRRRYVLNLDLEDFFPSINFGRVRGLLLKDKTFELSETVATFIAQIACDKIGLPQGSPCSPIIANLVANVLDARLVQLAKKHKCTYSRYADDITFSTNQKKFPSALAAPVEQSSAEWRLGKALIREIERSGFRINHKKTRMQHRGSRQVATGLLVNEKVNIRPEYYRTARAMCNSLFSTGSYYKMVPAALVGGALGGDPVKLTAENLDPLSGILAHIWEVKRNTDWGDIVCKKKSPYERTIFSRFLFYKYFAAHDRPIIVPEGKTDAIYVRAAIKRLDHFHPRLGQFDKGLFHSKLSFLPCTRAVQEGLHLGSGSGNLAQLIVNYSRTLRKFRRAPLHHPVILLIDNDDGATSLFKKALRKYGVSHKSTKSFYHLEHNLYLVKTPESGREGHSCIEDLFSSALRKTKLGDKTFDPRNDHDTDRTYGKVAFATNVIRPKIAEIDFSKFRKLLERVVAVLDDYEKQLAES